MELKQVVVGPVGTNCYILQNQDTKEAVLVDPGDSPKRLQHEIEALGAVPVAILLTHGHFDHIMAVNELTAVYKNVKVYACEAERELIASPSKNCCGMIGRTYTVQPDVYVTDGENMELAGIAFEVIATPGHTIGSCCYYIPEEGVLFSGDTIFAESVGRTDLPTGSMGTLVRSVRRVLEMLPDETVIYPGHEHATSIKHEKRYNPFA